ncbi:acyl-CoA N-acyltransferase [Pluteus cervinus]|uniref:Acyl-CoA N-acyltransferase n=1 Tax=Pluteus cervinus TaxID=181527 RepID=A0ACD3AK91_9AGAR|nr:acyl-CoA N-acyltransferase [Pluteus cervinus]
MPPTHVVQTKEPKLYTVIKNGVEHPAQILQRRNREVYVHYVDKDKRLDEWIPEEHCRLVDGGENDNNEDSGEAVASTSSAPAGGQRKRKRGPSAFVLGSGSRSGSVSASVGRGSGGDVNGVEGDEGQQTEEVVMTEEDFDIQHHKQITAQRNFDTVHFGDWQIKTWYFSPYPLIETEVDDIGQADARFKIPGVHRTTVRSHGRTSDLLAGGLGRTHAGDRSTLWVCEMCFKYMTDGMSWEIHQKSCQWKHPPGNKVYQRGAHTIWEVDGAVDKLYCQNLSLFGKLFIDVKTLFFDCDNFLFYILTDATSQEDHMLGFFSKEKVSYDDYNLACIMTLPPYQKKGYGMLMIEFSYELSRRAGKVGTPERPLSDLGLRSYLAYWVSTIIRFLRRVLSALPPEYPKVLTKGIYPDLTKSPPGEPDEVAPKRRKRQTKGWDGEPVDGGVTPYLLTFNDPKFSTERVLETQLNDDGSATTHVSIRCTLADIAKATNLRVEDAAFALNECGLLMQKIAIDDGNDEGQVLVLTRQLIEKVAAERKVKRPCMDLSRVLLE